MAWRPPYLWVYMSPTVWYTTSYFLLKYSSSLSIRGIWIIVESMQIHSIWPRTCPVQVHAFQVSGISELLLSPMLTLGPNSSKAHAVNERASVMRLESMGPMVDSTLYWLFNIPHPYTTSLTCRHRLFLCQAIPQPACLSRCTRWYSEHKYCCPSAAFLDQTYLMVILWFCPVYTHFLKDLHPRCSGF